MASKLMQTPYRVVSTISSLSTVCGIAETYKPVNRMLTFPLR